MIDKSTSALLFLADDDVNDSYLFRDAIEQIGKNLSLKSFKDGFELMNHLNDKKNILPDFIFLDLNMPGKNGFECLEEMRADERLKNICVIIYSTSSKLEDINESLNKGANLYFAKSSTFQELINRLRRIFAMNWDEFNSEPCLEKFVLMDEVGF